MPSYQISDPPTNPRLEEATVGGKAVSRGTVSFVVENKTPVKRMAVAKIIPDKPDDPGIYVITGSSKTLPTVSNLDLAPNQSQTIQVSITVPRGPVAKSGAFRLRVANDGDSDNDSIDSRPVAFEVPALSAGADPKRQFPWWALIAAVSVLITVAGASWYLLKPNTLTIDEIKKLADNSPIDDAMKTLQSNDLKPVRLIKRQDSAKPGVVINVELEFSDPATVYLSYDPGIRSLEDIPISVAMKTVSDNWKLQPQQKPDTESSKPPNIVSTAAVSGAPTAQVIVLSYDPGIQIDPPLQGKTLKAVEHIFSGLTGRATFTLVAAGDAPDLCEGVVIVSGQRPLAGIYKTHTQFVLETKRGTQKGLICTAIRDSVDPRHNPPVLNK